MKKLGWMLSCVQVSFAKLNTWNQWLCSIVEQGICLYLDQMYPSTIGTAKNHSKPMARPLQQCTCTLCQLTSSRDCSMRFLATLPGKYLVSNLPFVCFCRSCWSCWYPPQHYIAVQWKQHTYIFSLLLSPLNIQHNNTNKRGSPLYKLFGARWGQKGVGGFFLKIRPHSCV